MNPLPFPPLRLIGAPTDVGTHRVGSTMGPDALRVAQLGPALERLGLQVEDLGNLHGPHQQDAQPLDGLRNLAACQAWMEATHQAVAQALADGRCPVLLGGDHSLAMGSIPAVAAHCQALARPLRVIWLDAHADCNTPDITPSGNLHGMPVASLCGLGPAALTALSGSTATPTLRPEMLCQIGLRSVDPEEKRLLHQLGIAVYDMRAVDEMGMRAVMEQALRGLQPGQTHLHLSLDVDFLDPEIAPGTGTPVRGGPTYREAQLCMEMLADTGCLASVDVVELNPALDLRNQTAELVVDLLESLFGKSTLVRAR